MLCSSSVFKKFSWIYASFIFTSIFQCGRIKNDCNLKTVKIAYIIFWKLLVWKSKISMAAVVSCSLCFFFFKWQIMSSFLTLSFNQELGAFHPKERKCRMSREEKSLWPRTWCRVACRPAFAAASAWSRLSGLCLANCYTTPVFQFKCGCLDPLTRWDPLHYSSLCCSYIRAHKSTWKYLYRFVC